MGPEGAVAILYRAELEAAKNAEEVRQRRVKELTANLELVRQETAEDFIDPRDTRPVLIKALRLLQEKEVERPSIKHDQLPV